MEELSSHIKAERAILFIGAGATKDSGGLSWRELGDYIASKFGIPIKENPQEIFDELCDYKEKREEVYELVKERLHSVIAEESLKKILELPWLAIYTTNYDTAIEDYYYSSDKKAPLVIHDVDRVLQLGVKGVMPIFKLRGCRTVNINDTGEMILSKRDILRHQREEAEIYSHLDESIKAQAILAIGYSFSDSILLDAIERVRSLREKKNIHIYALFPNKNNGSMIEKLEKNNVNILFDTIKEFSPKLVDKVGISQGEQTIDIRMSNQIVSLNPSVIRDAQYSFDILTEEECRKPVPIEEFFRGKTSKAGAYESKLPWIREALRKSRGEIEQWMSNSHGPEHFVINFLGRPGSGRTVASNDLLHYLVTNYPFVGLRVPQRSHRLDGASASQIMSHILDKKTGFKNLGIAIVTDEYASMTEVLDFISDVECVRTRVIVIRSCDESGPSTVGDFHNLKIVNIPIDDGVSIGESESFCKYLSKIPPQVKIERLSIEEIQVATGRNPSFIELMYTLVNPYKKSLSEIIMEAYSELDDKEKEIIQYLLIPASIGVQVPLILLSKSTKIKIFDIYSNLDKCYKLVKVEEDGLEIPFVGIYHSRVADILLSVPRINIGISEQIKKMVLQAHLTNGAEHQLIADLLVWRPGKDAPVSKYCTNEEILELFAIARNKGTSRLLLHHYGIRLRNMRQYSESIEVLSEAMQIHEDPLAPTDRLEIIATTLAQTKWFLLREKNPDVDVDDPRILEIRGELKNSRTSSKWNPHSYDIESKILQELSRNRNGIERLQLLGEAVGLLKDGLSSSGGLETHLIERIADVMNEASGFIEKDAEELLTNYGNGHGYFLLYERALINDDNVKAQAYLGKALSSINPCPSAIRTFLDKELNSANPDYLALLKYSDGLVNFHATNPKKFSLSWNDHLMRVVCLIGAGQGGLTKESIFEVKRYAPKNIPQPYPYFIRSNGARKEFKGSIIDISSSTVGIIGSHNLSGYKGDIFFNPMRSKTKAIFKQGDRVKFNLAFGVYGMSAWDVAIFLISNIYFTILYILIIIK